MRGGLVLPRAGAFWLVAGVLVLLFFAAAAPSPLYGVYQAQWRFSATTLTAVFAAYALLLLITLLVFGSVSDYLGRRRVILAGLAAGRGRLRAVPGCGRRWAAVRRPGAAGRRRRHRYQRARRRADRPAARGQPARAGGHQRRRPCWAWARAGWGPARWSSTRRPHPPGLVAAARRLRRRRRRRAGDAGDRGGTTRPRCPRCGRASPCRGRRGRRSRWPCRCMIAAPA
jgi:hypothetical protein